VEHTVTEQVTGVDIVEAQFRLASGASLESMGLGDQQSVGAPRGYAVQARVVAQGGGTIRAYKEPAGPGVRVDACGYQGYAPPSQFDPLLAKVICSSSSSSSFASAVERTLRALDEFHIAGLSTNLPQLRAILAHPDFRAGDARTTLLADESRILGALASPSSAASENGGALALLEEQANTLVAGTGIGAPEPRVPTLEVETGQRAVECPIQSSVVEVRVTPCWS
jgi:pyruvate carboxylase